MITANDLVTTFDGSDSRYASGHVSHVAIYLVGYGAKWRRCVQVSVNWSAQGLVDASEAISFASDLMACTHLALECERLLTEKGYVIWREEK